MTFEDRIRDAERLYRSFLPEEIKIEWQVTHCPSCQKRVEFSPKKKDWDRKLLCPHCGRVFELPSLDGFVK